MNRTSYSKQLISFADQITLLKQRGLSFTDEIGALHLLQNISYYRLSGYWFLDASRFNNPMHHSKIIGKINEEYQRSDEEFVTAFKSKYSDSFPPSWITMEITSFGTLSILYNYLLPGQAKRNVATYFGLADTVFASWLHSIVYIRNICAHHSRLWNRTLSIRPLMPRRPHKPFIALPQSGTQHVYFILSMLVYMLDIINPNHSFVIRLKQLLHTYPDIDVRAMGFPADWEKEALWEK